MPGCGMRDAGWRTTDPRTPRTYNPVMRALLPLILAVALSAQEARVLQIEAVALDKKGNHVTELTREDLEVWINGRRIPVESVNAPEPGGRLLVLLLDDVTVDVRLAPRVRDAARRLVARMRPDDRMAVVNLSGGLIDITADQPKVLAKVDSYNQTAGFIPVERLGEHVLTTIAAVARAMGEDSSRRKAIVAIGSGSLLDRPIPPPQVAGELHREWQAAIRAMASADVTFYVIDPAGVGAAPAVAGSDGFAREAGGHSFINTNDLKGAADRILRELESYYEIRVADPPFGRNDPLRELEVRSLRRDITLRARRSISGT